MGVSSMMRIVATVLHYTRTDRESIRGRKSYRGAGLVFGLGLPAMLLLLNLAVAGPQMSLEQWRAAADAARALAENDVPRAHAEALRLQTALPADASQADRARALNLLARTEIYRGLSDRAAAHARQALALAQQADPIGQVEANLNLSL